MSGRLSYKKAMAQSLIKDVDLKRFAIITLLSYPNLKVDKHLAAFEADTTPASFPVLYRGLIKKLRDGGCAYTDAELGSSKETLTGAISYKKAADVLKDVDLKRLAIVYLLYNSEIKLTTELSDFAAAEADTTRGSFQVLLRNATKKLRDGNCELTADEETANNAASKTPKTPMTPMTPKTPKMAGSSHGGKTLGSSVKRNAGDLDEELLTPSKKPRGSKPKSISSEQAIPPTEHQNIVEQLKNEVDGMDETMLIKEVEDFEEV